MPKIKLILPATLMLILTGCSTSQVTVEENTEIDSPQLPEELHTRDNITRICPSLNQFEYDEILDQIIQTPGLRTLACLEADDKTYLATTNQPDRFTIYQINLTTSKIDQTANWYLADVKTAFVPPTKINQQDPHSFELSGTIQLADNTCQEAHYVYETSTNQITLVNQTEIPCPQ